MLSTSSASSRRSTSGSSMPCSCTGSPPGTCKSGGGAEYVVMHKTLVMHLKEAARRAQDQCQMAPEGETETLLSRTAPTETTTLALIDHEPSGTPLLASRLASCIALGCASCTHCACMRPRPRAHIVHSYALGCASWALSAVPTCQAAAPSASALASSHAVVSSKLLLTQALHCTNTLETIHQRALKYEQQASPQAHAPPPARTLQAQGGMRQASKGSK